MPEAPVAGTLADVTLNEYVHVAGGMGALPTDARKLATVTAFWLMTRTVSAVALEPSASAGLPYVWFGLEKYGIRVHVTPTAAQALL